MQDVFQIIKENKQFMLSFLSIFLVYWKAKKKTYMCRLITLTDYFYPRLSLVAFFFLLGPSDVIDCILVNKEKI